MKTYLVPHLTFSNGRLLRLKDLCCNVSDNSESESAVRHYDGTAERNKAYLLLTAYYLEHASSPWGVVQTLFSLPVPEPLLSWFSDFCLTLTKVFCDKLTVKWRAIKSQLPGFFTHRLQCIRLFVDAWYKDIKVPRSVGNSRLKRPTYPWIRFPKGELSIPE